MKESQFYVLTLNYSWNKLVTEKNPPPVKTHTDTLTFPLLWHDTISSLHNRFWNDSTRPERHSDSLALLCEFPLHFSGFPGGSISARHQSSL